MLSYFTTLFVPGLELFLSSSSSTPADGLSCELPHYFIWPDIGLLTNWTLNMTLWDTLKGVNLEHKFNINQDAQ